MAATTEDPAHVRAGEMPDFRLPAEACDVRRSAIARRA
jgi:hypothetical protein